MNESWSLWFVRLSGWPVFLTVVGAVLCLMLLLSVIFTKLAGRSVIENVLIAVVSLATLAFAVLALLAFFTRL